MDKFDHWVSLGYNCEVSFRIEEYQHRNIESYIFSWAYILNPSRYFLKSLNHIDDILNHEITFMSNGMFKDEKYQIAFHGKTPKEHLIDSDGKEIEDNVNKAIRELKDRFLYLGKKFKNLLKSNDRTLFIMKVQSVEDKDTTFKYVESIYKFLAKEYRSQNFLLLIILDNEEYRQEFEELVCNQFKVGIVSFFAPDDDTKNGSDIESWKNIFDEVTHY